MSRVSRVSRVGREGLNARSGLRRSLLIWSLVFTLAVLTGGCAPPPVVTQLPTTSAQPMPKGTLTSPGQCANPTQTYAPLPAVPEAATVTDARFKAIRARGFLIVGVSADSYLLGARNPLSGQLEGFDIDQARSLAKAIFGDPNKIQYQVITAQQRLPVLEERRVDLVARALTITCRRWEQIAFSANYYLAGQKVLVRSAPGQPRPRTSLAELAGRRVCAPAGTSSFERIGATSDKIVAVPAATHTACLVLFQQGQVDAITGDDTVLAGLAAQDPYAAITTAAPISQEPYGLGFNADDVYLVQYANAVLARQVADGSWQASYDRWFAPTLGAGAAPTPIYGRR